MAVRTERTATISAQSTFSGTLDVHGLFNWSLSGTWVGTITLQRSFDAGSNWVDVDSFTSNVETFGTEPEKKVLYRFGFKTGAYTSGDAVGRISL